MIYFHPGDTLIDGKLYKTKVVISQEEEEKHLSEGWSLKPEIKEVLLTENFKEIQSKETQEEVKYIDDEAPIPPEMEKVVQPIKESSKSRKNKYGKKQK